MSHQVVTKSCGFELKNNLNLAFFSLLPRARFCKSSSPFSLSLNSPAIPNYLYYVSLFQGAHFFHILISLKSACIIQLMANHRVTGTHENTLNHQHLKVDKCSGSLHIFTFCFCSCFLLPRDALPHLFAYFMPSCLLRNLPIQESFPDCPFPQRGWVYPTLHSHYPRYIALLLYFQIIF